MSYSPGNSNDAREQRKRVFDRFFIKCALRQLFQVLKDHNQAFVSGNDLENMIINVQYFDANSPGDCGRYFTPWTTEQMAKHAKNLRVGETHAEHQTRENRLDATIPFSERYFSQIPQWNDQWESQFHWTLPGQPHIKICMCSSIDGDPKQILRTELLTIVATMGTLLNQADFQHHMAIPVMLISFMGRWRGRILTAYCKGPELVVRMSRLYRFLSQDVDSMSLVTRYLASYADGETHELPT
ncbi:uncharacterized protein KD926_009995 [Aspergillus affinis]|uniref:uncharacterized protein n=1 Tax=Aspergillus affinis TaxID=1070780 RepID=UPI0022FF23DF|nr:uncharacterized protein KD926_009995 [Aspergillus affinis]KAI9039011.1 hypothetical protein KD926_009995 [Aspergillus affinis]